MDDDYRMSVPAIASEHEHKTKRAAAMMIRKDAIAYKEPRTHFDLSRLFTPLTA